MNDEETTLRELSDLVLRFSKERNWEQFHHPKDLGVALACEVGEILEHFRYRSNEEIQARLEDPAYRREIAHELADSLWMILRMAQVCGIDLAASFQEKVALAALKYPADLAFGRNDKYTAYDHADLGKGDPA